MIWVVLLPRLSGVEKERRERVMQGVAIRTLGNVGGLLSAIVGFIILVVGYIAFVEKVPIRSDFMVYFMLLNIALLVGLFVAWYYTTDREIRYS
jgi:hypothetical protein